VRHLDLRRVDVRHCYVDHVAVVVEHVDAAPVGQARHDHARDALQRGLVVEGRSEQLPGLGEEALAQLGVLGDGDVLDDVDGQPGAVRLLRQRRLGEQPVRLAGVLPDAAREQLLRLLALHQPPAGQVLDGHRTAVLVQHREVLGELAWLRRQHLVDVLAAEQLRRRGVRVDGLAALVVDGDRLAERAEDAVEPCLRGVEVDGERRGLLARASGDHGEQRDEPVEDDAVDRRTGPRRVVPEQAADADRERHGGGDRGLALGADHREDERHEQGRARDDEPGSLDRDVQHGDRDLQRERDPEAGCGRLTHVPFRAMLVRVDTDCPTPGYVQCMRALTVIPLQAGSAEVVDMPDPEPGPGELLVDGIALGVCGTDREIIAGDYGWAPPGAERLILGHESLGRVLEAPDGSGFAAGDLVVGVVRRPDPEPCPACAHGQFDFCRNGRYTERGIKELHGYGSERWTVEAEYAVKLDPALESVGMLMEPTTIVAKAWDQIERIGRRAYFDPQRVLVTGAGPIGLLAALLGAQRGLDVHVLDRNRGGAKPRLVHGLGASYHYTDVEQVAKDLEADIIIEATGAPDVVFDVMEQNAAFGIVCLTGVSPHGRNLTIDVGTFNRNLVLENDVVFGSVNANLDHYALAAGALAKADRRWLESLVSRRVPLEDFEQALEKQPDDVKVVLEL
jgi:threonine dehydrogenase-like Zn-dependent dehydrogenase